MRSFENIDCLAAYIVRDWRILEKFKSDVEKLITKYSVYRYIMTGAEPCIDLCGNLDGFEIYGCLNDLAAAKILDEVARSIRMQCEDYVT